MADGLELRRSWLLIFFLLVSGCAETDLRLLSPSPPFPFEELKQRVSAIRELPFLSEVALETSAMAEIRALLEGSLLQEQGQEKLSQVAWLYTRLGLLAEATDLPKAVLDLRLFQRAVQYDSQRKAIVLPKERLKPGLAFLRSPWSVTEDTAKELLLIHALTHALQDQHFHWHERLKRDATEDSAMALRALMRGDAVLVGLAHLVAEQQGAKQKIVDGVTSMIPLAAQLDQQLSGLPELLRQGAAFQYLNGSQFVLWAYARQRWDGVNGLFFRPPVSTEQILHPEKYYVKREEPVQITPWSLIRQFGAKKIIDETLGEFVIRILLGQTLSKDKAARAATGWAGDSLFAFREGREIILAWMTAWDDREDALEFYSSYRDAIEKRREISLEPTAGGSDTLVAPEQSGHRLLLQIRDHFVFFLDGIPVPRSVEIAKEVWKELETGTEPARTPFELAGRPIQPFWIKR